MVEPFGFVRRLGSLGGNFSGPVNSSPTAAGDATIHDRADNMPTRLARGVVAILVTLGCIAVFVPFAPRFPESGLDPGWLFALNAAVEKGMVFGRDIFFTYGPYASAVTREYHPAIDTRMLWSSGLLALAFAAALMALARDRYKLSALLITTLLGLFSGDQFSGDQLLFCIPMSFNFIVSRITMPSTHPSNLVLTAKVLITLILLVIAFSLLVLIKGNAGIAAVAIGALGWALLMLKDRKRLAMSGALLFAAGILAFWAVASQPLGLLPTFFASQGQIISGYSGAMSLRGPDREPIIYIVACCLLGLLNYRLFRSSGLSGLVLVTGNTLLLFIAFKQGFVRHDIHAVTAAGMLGLTGCLSAIGLRGARSILALVIGLAGWALIDGHYTSLNMSTLEDRIVQPLVDSATGLLARVEEPDALRKRFDESLSAIRAEQPLPPLPGTADVYSYGQSILLANGLDWAPRPILQSYSAYTPLLAEKDAAHLTGEAAPDNILFTVQPIDGRLPSLEDGLSWPSLLTRYEPAALIGDMAILQRTLKPTSDVVVREPAIVAGAYGLGEDISLPTTDGALWAKVDLKPTLLGRIVDTLYKLPELQIAFRMPDGSVSRFRYIAGMGETGFVVSPLVQNTIDFLALELLSTRTKAYLADSRPQSVSISVDGGSAARWLWKRKLSVRVFRMDIPTQPRAASLLFNSSPAAEPVTAGAAKLPETKDCVIDRVNDRPGDRPPTVIRGVLRIDGWAALSIADGAAPDQTTITLTGRNGDVHSISAKIIARDDVNEYFNRPKLGKVGYSGVANVSALNGEYTVGIQVSQHGIARTCSIRIPISIISLDSEK